MDDAGGCGGQGLAVLRLVPNRRWHRRIPAVPMSDVSLVVQREFQQPPDHPVAEGPLASLPAIVCADFHPDVRQHTGSQGLGVVVGIGEGEGLLHLAATLHDLEQEDPAALVGEVQLDPRLLVTAGLGQHQVALYYPGLCGAGVHPQGESLASRCGGMDLGFASMPRLLIRSVEFEGPFYKSWPPATHRNIFIDFENKDDPAAYAREVIRSFATRAINSK